MFAGVPWLHCEQRLKQAAIPATTATPSRTDLAGLRDRSAVPHHRGMAEDPGDTTGWVVWRQDDNGNRYEVARHDSRAAAEAQAEQMEARGHKQTYWVAAK